MPNKNNSTNNNKQRNSKYAVANRSNGNVGSAKKSGKYSSSDQKRGAERYANDDSASMTPARREAAAYDAREAHGRNDLNFYVVSQMVLRDVANMAWNQATGSRINLHNPIFSGLTNQGSFTVPGVCTYWLVPTFGNVQNNNDAINVAANFVYTYVRHANSGARNYDPLDLMIAISAVADVFSMIEWLKRIYKTIAKYDFYNRYLPDAVLTAQRIDVSSIRRNLADFRARINLMVASLHQFAIPSTLPIFGRRVMVYSAMYKEGDTPKDQYYQYAPVGFYKFALDADGAGSLVFDHYKYHESADESLTADSLCDWAETLVRQVLTIPDIALIMGDVLKAYGSNLITMPELGENDELVISTDLNVLEQMKNATVCNSDFYNYPVLRQDPTKGWLLFDPVLSFKDATDVDQYKNAIKHGEIQTFLEDRLMTTIRVEPNPGDLMEISRLTVAGDEYSYDTTSKIALVNLYCGSEICIEANITTFVYTDATSEITVSHASNIKYVHAYDTTEADPNELISDFRLFARASNFKFHPALHVLGARQSTTNTNAANFTEAYYFYDVDNFMELRTDEIRNLHTTALLAEFGLR